MHQKPRSPGPAEGSILWPGRHWSAALGGPKGLPTTHVIILVVLVSPLSPALLRCCLLPASPKTPKVAALGRGSLVQPVALRLCSLPGTGLSLLPGPLLQLLGRDGCLPPSPQRGPCTASARLLSLLQACSCCVPVACTPSTTCLSSSRYGSGTMQPVPPPAREAACHQLWRCLMTGLGHAMPVVPQTAAGQSSTACGKSTSSQPCMCKLDPGHDLLCHDRHLRLDA